MPVGKISRALIDGARYKEALYAVNSIVPFSVLRQAVYEAKSVADQAPFLLERRTVFSFLTVHH